MFGIVAVAGTYYIQWAAANSLATHGLEAMWQLPMEVLLVGLPVGALVTNVMLVDDMRDRSAWELAHVYDEAPEPVEVGAGAGKMAETLAVHA